jgi:twinkle protein
MRANELAKRLANRVEDVCRELLPNGKRDGHEWRVGSIAGEAGKSMGVHLTGEKAGVWLDGESGDKGDLIGLWMATRNMDLRAACTEAAEFLGINEAKLENQQRRVYAKPTREGVTMLSPDHARWLTDTRKLPAESIAAYKLASRGDRLMFPYLIGDELIFAKYRKLPKQFSADADCEPVLFGWQAISPRARAIVLTEGELDAIAFHAYGFPALSVPTGAGGHGWIEREYERLDAFDTIYLSMDMDAAGQKHIATLCERLGRERTKVVTLPRKDANACLIEGVTRETIICALRDARTMDPAELRAAVEFEDEVIAEFDRVDDGMTLPWRKGETLLLRDSEVSVWAGVNGHGKSELVGQVVAYQAFRCGVRSCVASFELTAARWLKRMYRQVAGIQNPTKPFLRHISARSRDLLWVFNERGTAKAQRLLDVFRYARKRYGVKLFVIDNFAKLGIAEDDYSEQKKFVDDLTDFANDTGAHVMLVVHMRKGEDENRPAGKMSVKGTGAITDMVDTVLEVWRNKPREEAKRKAAQAAQLGAPSELPEKFRDQPDTMLICHKQRNGECEPKIGLYFNPSAHQFLAKEHYQPRAMVEISLLDAEAARLSA